MPNNNIEWCSSELINIKEHPDKFPVTKESIISFVDILISNAAGRTGISENVIREYNKPFYEWLEFYFKTYKCLVVTDTSKEFNKLCSLFKVPVIKKTIRSEENMLPGEDKIPKIRHTGNIMDNSKGCGMPTEHRGIGFISEKKTFTHKDCMEMFNKLSTEEKIKFIVNFQEVEIKLSPSDILVIKSL